MRRIKMVSLDFMMYAYERRLEEDELLDEGYMCECERLSVAEMKRSYAEYLRSLAGVVTGEKIFLNMSFTTEC